MKIRPVPELRQDPVTGRWVIVAPNRAGRPDEFAPAFERVENAGDCPFCPGREAETPPAVLVRPDPATPPDGPAWRMRVVPNKFPALVPDGEPGPRSDGFFGRTPGVGVCEVIVETAAHLTSLTQLRADDVGEVLAVYRDRLNAQKSDPRLQYGLIFKNKGATAGASLEHCHSQLIATPLVPPAVAAELRGAECHHRAQGRCVFCQMIDRETASGERVVFRTAGYVVFCPFAGRFPYETWILPRRHASRFEDVPLEGLRELGAVLHATLGKLEVGLDDPAYNTMIHTAPLRSGDLEHYHWHLEIIPRLTGVAGFEWGGGMFINTVPPEQAAARLRETTTNDAKTTNGGA